MISRHSLWIDLINQISITSPQCVKKKCGKLSYQFVSDGVKLSSVDEKRVINDKDEFLSIKLVTSIVPYKETTIVSQQMEKNEMILFFSHCFPSLNRCQM